MTEARASSNVSSMAVARARRLLDEMMTKPFCVLIFDGDRVSGVTKGLSDEDSEIIRNLIQGLDA